MRKHLILLLAFGLPLSNQLMATPLACEQAQTQKMSAPELLKLTGKICDPTNGSQDPDESVEEMRNEAEMTAEQYLIFQYSKNCFNAINPALYNPAQSKPETLALARQLDRALCEQKKFEGIVYRGMNLSDELAKNYIAGSEVNMPSFTSTSKKSHIGCEFVEKYGGNALIKIYSKNGYEIEDLSHHSDEAEVLFRLNTPFKVRFVMTGFQAKIMSQCKVNYYIEMEEIN